MRYKNYINSHSKSNRIYSRDEVLDMPLRRIRDNKLELESQYRSIGVPTTESLRFSENVVWVEEYTRDDGTKVSGHWRSKPDGENISDPMRSILPQDNGTTWKMNMNGGTADGNSSENPMQSILGTIMEMLKLNSQDSSNNGEEGALTGGAAGVKTPAESMYRTPSGYNYKTGEAFYQNWDKDGNVYYTNSKGEIVDRSLDKWQQTQQHIYEEKSQKDYPISSRFVIDAMHNFAAAKQDENAEILHGMDQLKPSVKQALKDYGVPENSKGVIYNEKSSVSESFSKSSLLKGWAKNPEIQEKIMNGTLTETDKKLHFKENNPFNKEEFDHHSSIQHTKIVNPQIKDGYMEGTLIDYYDFKQRPESLKNIPNNWGYEMQEKGILQNYYICIKVRVKL